jgi:hypothetical protein
LRLGRVREAKEMLRFLGETSGWPKPKAEMEKIFRSFSDLLPENEETLVGDPLSVNLCSTIGFSIETNENGYSKLFLNGTKYNFTIFLLNDDVHKGLCLHICCGEKAPSFVLKLFHRFLCMYKKNLLWKEKRKIKKNEKK